MHILRSLALGVVCALLCMPAAGQPVRVPEQAATNFAALLGDTIALERQLEIEAAKSARDAQAFGASLSAADRRELTGACTALVANPNDADASQRLELIMSRYRDNNAEAIMRFCLEPSIRQLRADLQASRQTLERPDSGAADAQANIDLQNGLQKQQQTFTSISNVMKTKHFR